MLTKIKRRLFAACTAKHSRRFCASTPQISPAKHAVIHIFVGTVLCVFCPVYCRFYIKALFIIFKEKPHVVIR